MTRWRVVLMAFEPWHSILLGLAPTIVAMFLVTGPARTLLPASLLSGVAGGFLGAGIDTAGRRDVRMLAILGCASALAAIPLIVAAA